MPGKTRPRPWSSLDREYLSQDTIRELGDRFGPVGPLTFLAIILEAGKVTGARPGLVELRFSALALLSFTAPKTVREVVHAAAEVGLLADLDDDGERFRARLTRWERWESKDRTAAQRAAEYRARQEQPA
jgi:hypothetical protein